MKTAQETCAAEIIVFWDIKDRILLQHQQS